MSNASSTSSPASSYSSAYSRPSTFHEGTSTTEPTSSAFSVSTCEEDESQQSELDSSYTCCEAPSQEATYRPSKPKAPSPWLGGRWRNGFKVSLFSAKPKPRAVARGRGVPQKSLSSPSLPLPADISPEENSPEPSLPPSRDSNDSEDEAVGVDEQHEIPPVPPLDLSSLPVVSAADFKPLIFNFPGASKSKSSLIREGRARERSPYFLDRQPSPFTLTSHMARYGSTAQPVLTNNPATMTHMPNPSLESNSSTTSSNSASSGSGSSAGSLTPPSSSSSRSSTVDLALPTPTSSTGSYPFPLATPLAMKDRKEPKAEILSIEPQPGSQAPSPIDPPQRSGLSSFWSSPRERVSSGVKKKLTRRQKDSSNARPSTAPGGSVGRAAFLSHTAVVKDNDDAKRSSVGSWVAVNPATIPVSGPSPEEVQKFKQMAREEENRKGKVTSRKGRTPVTQVVSTERRRLSVIIPSSTSPRPLMDTTPSTPTKPSLTTSRPSLLVKQSKGTRPKREPSMSPDKPRFEKTGNKTPLSPPLKNQETQWWPTFAPLSSVASPPEEPPKRVVSPPLESLLVSGHPTRTPSEATPPLNPAKSSSTAQPRVSPSPAKGPDVLSPEQPSLRVKRASIYGGKEWSNLPLPDAPPPSAPLPRAPRAPKVNTARRREVKSEWIDF